MKLIQLHVENFGKLSGYDLRFRDGLQILCHENGWGKSTLAVFIKAMLFGLPATTKRSLDENERKKYTPWKGGAFGGSLDFSCQKGSFRIERFFGAKESEDRFVLFDLSTNRPSNAFSEAVGVELFGIDAAGFERSTYLSQAIYDVKAGNAEIGSRLGSLLDDVDDIGSIDQAREFLEKNRRHYVTTGNRGEIAVLEQEIAATGRELELLGEKEESRRAQEAELTSLCEQISALQNALNATRNDLQKAALFRETNALLERKNGMLKELGELAEEKKKLRDYFQGFPPSTQELTYHVELHEKLKESLARMNAIPASPSEPEVRQRLLNEYKNGMPRSSELEVALRQNEELHRVCDRIEVLRGLGGDGDDAKFAAGLPTRASIDEARATLAQASKQKQALVTLRSARAEKETPVKLFSFVWLTLALGAILLILGFLPFLKEFSLPLIILGGASLLLSVVLGLMGVRARNKQKSELEALDTRIAEGEKQIDAAHASVCALLKTYGMSTDDLSASLAELLLLSEQTRERRSKQHSLFEELRGLESRRRKLADDMKLFLSRYLGGADEKSDYRAELDRLCRDADLWARLESEERKRRFDRASEAATQEDLKKRLSPFLRRYDTKGKMTAAECLDMLTQKREEYNRICKEMTRRENDLKTFIAEKNLDAVDPNFSASYVDLSAQERELLGRIEELQRKKTVLKSSIDRLGAETDTIGEVESRLARLQERHKVAKANYATISKTLAFLEEANDALSTRYLGDMRKHFDAYLGLLMGKDAPDSMMDDRFDVRLQGGGQARTMESFSRGWRDAVQFCVRLSLADALFAEGEAPFLLLDDPFVNLDDSRHAAARKLLDEVAKKYQTVYFVCREASK